MTYCRAAGLRPATIKLRGMWLRRAARSVDLRLATPGDLIDWLAAHDWQPETRKSARSALRSFYAWATESGHLAHNPAAKLPPVRVPPGVPHPTPTDILRRALGEASARDRLMLALAAFAGLRRTEIAELRWSHVDHRVLSITGKGGRRRLIPVLPQLGELLGEESALRAAGRVADGFRFAVDPFSPFVFPSHCGGHISPFTVGKILSAALGPGWHGHTLRHRFATKAYAVDRDLLVVQQLMGHSNPDVTARYTAVPRGAALAAVKGAAA